MARARLIAGLTLVGTGYVVDAVTQSYPTRGDVQALALSGQSINYQLAMRTAAQRHGITAARAGVSGLGWGLLGAEAFERGHPIIGGLCVLSAAMNAIALPAYLAASQGWSPVFLDGPTHISRVGA